MSQGSSPGGERGRGIHSSTLRCSRGRRSGKTHGMFEPHAAAASADGTLHLPSADDASIDAVIDHLQGMCEALPEFSVRVSMRHALAVDLEHVPIHGEAFVMMVPLLETCLDDDADDVDLPLIAQFAFMSMVPAMPESVALQIAFGRSVGEEQVREFARLFARARQRGLSIDEYVGELVARDAVPRGKLVRLLHGETRRKPDAERIQQGIALLRRIASLVPSTVRPPLLCAIAWLYWARGKRAIAMAYLAEAARIEPEHILARGLSWLVTTKTPAWL